MECVIHGTSFLASGFGKGKMSTQIIVLFLKLIIMKGIPIRKRVFLGKIILNGLWKREVWTWSNKSLIAGIYCGIWVHLYLALWSIIVSFPPNFYLICRCIQIRDLHKVYATKKGKCCAVNSLRLTLYENQILALLGKSVQILWWLYNFT